MTASAAFERRRKSEFLKSTRKETTFIFLNIIFISITERDYESQNIVRHINNIVTFKYYMVTSKNDMVISKKYYDSILKIIWLFRNIYI